MVTMKLPVLLDNTVSHEKASVFAALIIFLDLVDFFPIEEGKAKSGQGNHSLIANTWQVTQLASGSWSMARLFSYLFDIIMFGLTVIKVNIK